MVHSLKHIGAHSAGKMYGATMGAFSLLVAVPFGLFSLFTEDVVVGIAMILFMPILYFVIGYLAGGFIAFIYNFVARRIGGVEIELEEKM